MTEEVLREIKKLDEIELKMDNLEERISPGSIQPGVPPDVNK
jgi:hypothetical protein